MVAAERLTVTLVVGSLVAVCAAGAAGLAAGQGAHEPQLAYHADPGGSDDLFTIGADGRHRQRLTTGLEEVATPYWSPDGQWIAFLARASGAQEVYVVDAHGRHRRQVTSTGTNHWALGWSPDGSSLVFECCGEGKADIQVVSAKGGKPRTLARNAGQPRWSKQGRLAFLSFRDGNPEIYVMDADGGNQRRLTRNAAEDSSPAWSPDGTKIAFASKRTGRSQIWVMNADGSGQRRIVVNRWYDDEPGWSPNGRLIIFTSFRNRDPLLRGIGNAEIETVRPDGSALHSLTHTSFWEGDPAWSPSGGRIAFAFRRDSGRQGTFQLGVMSANGSHVHALPMITASGGPANSCCPAWRP